MQKSFIFTIIFLSFANASFACGCDCNGKSSFAASNEQKACQNVFSLITIDFSFLSPRATAADVHVGMPKRFMNWGHKCCQPNCSQPCAPQCVPCSPCAPQECPKCRTQSMTTDENDEAMAPADDKQEKIIPVSNTQEFKKSDVVSSTKTRFFKIDFFRHFKV